MYRFFQKALTTVIILGIVWIAGFGFFVFSIPRSVSDTTAYTEAIVVLTGGRERLKTGFKLLCNEQAKVLFISGVHPHVGFTSLLKAIDFHTFNCPLTQEDLKASTHLGFAAKNTQENAEEIAEWINQQKITSLRLVTAAYHMPRSMMQLKHLFPHLIIVPHPVFPYGQEILWWWHEGAIYLLLSEYHKFLLGYIRMLFH